MSSNRYLEVDSTYRDRTVYPNPAQFVMEISQSGQKARAQALDPVSTASAHKVFWPGNDFNVNALTGNFDLSTATPLVSNDSGMVTFVITIPVAQAPNLTEDYYKGAILANTTPTPDVLRRITAWKYLKLDTLYYFQVTVDRAFPDTTADGDAIAIRNPTDFTDTSNPQIFIPGGESMDNYYQGYRIYNQTLSISSGTADSRVITYYDGTTHIATLDTSTAGGGPVTSWTVGTGSTLQAFVLRKDNPCGLGVTNTGSSAGSIVLPAGSTSVTGAYTNYFLRLPTTATGATGPVGETRRIVSYTGGPTGTANVYPNFTTGFTAGSPYELLCFTKDNMVPFVYTGSLTSQQQSVCYEVELLNLVLPNQTLESGKGGRIAFYPYVYVELHNVSAPTTNSNSSIYSNNPNSNKMLFRAVVDDTPTPLISPFIKIDSDGMSQTVKFKPNDSFKFSVYHANGELFTLRSLNTNSSTGAASIDTTGPEEPDPLVQISALFSLKRVQ